MGWKITLGCAIFALGFDLFLEPNSLNVGGMSGLAMILRELLGFGSIGVLTMLLNVPLFVLGARKLGKKFLFGSLAGMLLSSAFIDLFAVIPAPKTEILLDSLYGGLLVGLGLGLVFLSGATTGGSDIAAKLLRRRFRSASLGKVLLAIDLFIIFLTGVVFRDISRTLYSALPLAVSSVVMDQLLYGLDHSTVALIISEHYQQVSKQIETRLDRGATVLDGSGSYTVVVYEQVEGNSYAQVLSKSIQANMSDEYAPFLSPNRYSWYTQDSQVVALAQELCAGLSTDREKAQTVYDYVVSTMTYDYMEAVLAVAGQMHMHVDESGQQIAPAQVDACVPRRGSAGRHDIRDRLAVREHAQSGLYAHILRAVEKVCVVKCVFHAAPLFPRPGHTGQNE